MYEDYSCGFETIHGCVKYRELFVGNMPKNVKVIQDRQFPIKMIKK